MKIIKVVLAILFASFGYSRVYAADPVAIVPGLPESAYNYTNDSISVTSYTVAAIVPDIGYRNIMLQAPSSFFYRLDGVSSNVKTTGYPVQSNLDAEIETIGAVYLQMPSGTAETVIRVLTKKK